jgi:HPt (histidine-containing phosphotransfer) domain-containing protein
MTNTAQSEAMQAVRLLRGHALSGALTQAQIEALYQACKLLEGFIEGKSATSENTPDMYHDIRTYHVGDDVITQGGQSGVISGFDHDKRLVFVTRSNPNLAEKWHISQVYIK